MQGVRCEDIRSSASTFGRGSQGSLKNAYCRYSGFPVGAAVLTTDGSIFVGCNVENVSFGLSMCAERSAIFQAVAQHGKEVSVRAVVIFTRPQLLPALVVAAAR